MASFHFAQVVLAQNATIDSLERILPTLPQDTGRVTLLLDLSYEFRNIDPDRTIEFAAEALDLARQLGFRKGEAHALRNVGMGYYKKSDYDTAMALCKQALVLAEQANSPRERADVLNTIGIIHYLRSEYDSSVTIFEEILTIYEELDREIDKAGTYANLAGIVQNQGNIVKAIDYYQQALTIFEKYNNLDGMATVLHNMANIYDDQNEHQKALEYYTKTASLDSITGNKRGRAFTVTSVANLQIQLLDTPSAIQNYHLAISLFKEAGARCQVSAPQNNLADLYLAMKSYDSARFYLNAALEIASGCEDKGQLIEVYMDFGKYYKTFNNRGEAENYLTQSMSLARELELEPKIAEVANELYLFYDSYGVANKALENLRINKELEDKLFNEKNTRRIERLEAEYEFSKEKQQIAYDQELEIARYDERLNNQKTIQLLVIIGLIIASVLAAIIGRLYLMKNRTNVKLRSANDQLIERNSEILAQNEEIMQQRDQIEERSKVVEEQQVELQRKNNELISLNEEKNALIGVVAHDLKTPLNQIAGMANLAKLSIDDMPDDTQEYFDKMEDSYERSMQMIDRILDVNAIENKKLDLDIKPTRLKDVLDKTCASFSKVASDKGIKLNCLYTQFEAVAMVDTALSLEVFENLVSNALKFSDSGSQVYLEADELENMVHVKVRDEGPGISEEDQKVLFNKYQRLSAQPTAGEKSSGLGLAIVKRFVEEMGGSVWCESQLGEGTTFIVAFNKVD